MQNVTMPERLALRDTFKFARRSLSLSLFLLHSFCVSHFLSLSLSKVSNNDLFKLDLESWFGRYHTLG